MTTCNEVQNRLPEYIGGQFGEAEAALFEAHLDGCDDCRSAFDIVSLLSQAPPSAVPAGLEARLQEAVRHEVGRSRIEPRRRQRPRVPVWGLAAAAGLALAVATPVLMDQMGSVPEVTVDEAEVTALLTESFPSPWFGDEGTVAGAPVLDDLSDAALLQLLEEME